MHSSAITTVTPSALSLDLIREYQALTHTEDLPKAQTVETVQQLLKAHCRTFAFSTLAANLAEEKVIPESTSLATYLLKHKSGLCFHHNNTFYEVLKYLGFNAHLIACQFQRPRSETLYPLSTHVAILLAIDGMDYLLDPGFGFGFTDPIPLQQTENQKKIIYKISKADTHFELYDVSNAEHPVREYVFDSKPVAIQDFQAGIDTFHRNDVVSATGELIEQGHLFYSLFFYSKNVEIDDRNVSVMALLTRNSVTTDRDNHSCYNQMLSLFKPPRALVEKLEKGQFSNPKLQTLVFEEQTPGALQRSSAQHPSARR